MGNDAALLLTYYTLRRMYRQSRTSLQIGAIMSGGIIYQVDIEKAIGIETWTNVYYVQASGVTQALTYGQQIAAIEVAVHIQDVRFTRVRARQVSELASAGSQINLGASGGYAGIQKIPLFVCARVIFQQTASRPSVKYLRGCVETAGFLDRFTYTVDEGTRFATNYCDPLANLEYLCSRDGAGFEGIVFQQKIAEHQLRRGSKRKAIPVLG